MVSSSKTMNLLLLSLLCVVFPVIDTTLYHSLKENLIQFQKQNAANKTFTLDNDEFVLNGEKIKLYGGCFHYFRCHPAQWRDRLIRMKHMGLNTVQTYIAWNFHNEDENVYNFEGNADFEKFILLAQDIGLHVIVRPGPYICAEWDFGGLPAWLLNPKKGILGSQHLRTYYQPYIDEVDKWWRILLPKLAPLLVQNGGPILMVQIENEFGSYGDVSSKPNDRKYLKHLINLARSHLGQDAILFTTDGGNEGFMKRGSFQGGDVYTVGDFGSSSDPSVSFDAMKKFNPPGQSPNYNSEYYSGWLTHWGEKMANVSSRGVGDTLQNIIDLNGGMSIYMAFGGTNFGFWSGANYDKKYMPHITSYDYDAPISEDGNHGYGSDGLDKYAVIQGILRQNTGDISVEPVVSHTVKYNDVNLNEAANFIDSLELLSEKHFLDETIPQRMEAYQQNSGFIMYSRTLPCQVCDNQNCSLSIREVRDRAIVFVDQRVKGTVYRNSPSDLTFECSTSSSRIDILVENMGRINFGWELYDPKGIVGDGVFINQKALVGGWSVRTIPLKGEQLSNLPFAQFSSLHVKLPAFYRGTFNISSENVLQDTFIDARKWSKGIVWVNGNNLGRYWQQEGPQCTLYVPWPFLKVGQNEIIILEVDQPPNELILEFSSAPVFVTKAN